MTSNRDVPDIRPRLYNRTVSTDILMPKLSDTMEEGKILKWLKHVGDAIAAGEVIAEVETDKADMELEAAESGVLSAIQVPEGESARGRGGDRGRRRQRQGAAAAKSTAPESGARKAAAAPSAAAGAESEDTDEAPPEPKPAAKKAASSPRPPAERPRDAPKASAAARALAAERGIDLAGIAGSGPDGRIVSEDVGSGEREDGSGRRRRVELLATVKRRSPSGTSSRGCGSRLRAA